MITCSRKFASAPLGFFDGFVFHDVGFALPPLPLGPAPAAAVRAAALARGGSAASTEQTEALCALYDLTDNAKVSYAEFAARVDEIVRAALGPTSSRSPR